MKKALQLTRVKTFYLVYDGIVPQKDAQYEIEKWEKPKVEDYLELYKRIGEKWGWTGRLVITDIELEKIIHSKENEIYLFKDNGEVKGFFEIDKSVRGSAEIVYLGLFPNEIGKGYGKSFLNAAIAIAGQDNRRVWLHTCEYDHPKALSIYLKAGFIIELESVEEEYYHLDFLAKHKNV